MANKHIREYLNNYINPGASEFAVLINGEWGSGKTWFINDFITKRKEKDILYISLFGLSSIQDIDCKILENYLDSVGAPKKSIVWKIFGLFGSIGNLGSILSTLKNLSSALAKEYNKFNIIVLDDLERCGLCSKALFGYINDLLTRENKKVILIVNEKEMGQHNNQSNSVNEYQEVKEKTVGRAFHLTPDTNLAFDSFVSLIRDSNKKLASHLEKYKNQILEAYKKTGYNNLRNLKYFFEEMRILWGCIPAYAIENKGLMEELIENLMIFLVETREGMITIDDIKEIPRRLHSPRLHTKDNESTKDEDKFFKKYCESPSDKYPVKRPDLFYDLLPSSTFWYLFLRDGTFDKNEMEKSIKNSKYFSSNSSQDQWVNLWYFRKLNEEIFVETLNKVRGSFEKNIYTQPEVILHIAGILLALSRKKIIKDSIEHTVEYIKNKIDELTSLNKLDCFEKNAALESGSSHGLGFYDFGSAEFNIIFDSLKSNIMKMKDGIIENNLRPILQGSLADIEELLVQNPDNARKYSSKILIKIEPSQLANRIMKLPPEDALIFCDKISAWLRYIYENGFYPKISMHGNDPASQDKAIGNINQEVEKQNRWLVSVGEKLDRKKEGLSELRKYQIDCYRAHLGIRVKEE